MTNYHDRAIPYPVWTLPENIRTFVDLVCSATEGSAELVGPVVLSAMAAAVQSTVDVRSASGLRMPTSLFFGVVVPSGERKSSVLQHVTPAFEHFEQNDLGGITKPPFLLEQATEPGLVDLFQQGARSIFFAFPEGSQLLKGLDYPAFCKRFDGAPIRHTTRKKGTVIVSNTRSSVCLLIQNTTFARHMAKKSEMLIDSGFLPRMLMSFPTPHGRTHDHRQWSWRKEPSSHPFHDRISELLRDYAQWLSKDKHERTMLVLDPEATRTWEHFYNEMQHRLARSRQPYGWQEEEAFIQRAGEHVLRLSAVIQWFEAQRDEVQAWAVHAAIEIVLWHLDQAMFVFGEPPLEIQAQEWARMLHDYLLRHQRMTGRPRTYTKSELLRCVPKEIRKADRLNTALDILAKQHTILTQRKGNTEDIMLNAMPPLRLSGNPYA